MCIITQIVVPITPKIVFVLTKFGKPGRHTKIKHCYHFFVDEYTRVRKQSKQKVKARQKKGTLT